MKNFLLTPIIALAFFMGAVNVSAEEWITEEVLKQLSEATKELKLLKAEVSTLSAEIKSLKSGGPARGQNAIKEVELGNLPRLGSKKASIVVVEFSEFQCPYCVRHFKQTMPLIKSNYIDTNKIQYVSRDFPLGFHANAKGAAVAVRCAAEQNDDAYWAMHDGLFTQGPSGLKTDNYKKLAKENNLNTKKFAECLDNPAIAKLVDADSVYGQQVGVSGTPAFLIGKLDGDKIVDVKRLTGAQPYSAFASAIDSMLK